MGLLLLIRPILDLSVTSLLELKRSHIMFLKIDFMSEKMKGPITGCLSFHWLLWSWLPQFLQPVGLNQGKSNIYVKVKRGFVDIKPHDQKQKEMKGGRGGGLALLCDAFVVLGGLLKLLLLGVLHGSLTNNVSLNFDINVCEKSIFPKTLVANENPKL